MVRIGSRGSELALWQANHVKDALESAGYEVEIKIIKTKGDRIQHLSFDKIEGKGFFTKEIEEQLLQGEIDLAVHSLKDLETEQPEGLKLAALSARNSPHDVLLVKESSVDNNGKWNLPQNAVVGTSSARRQAWLKQYREDVELVDIRGNVPTRIQKLRDGDMDAIVLAEAGLNRISPNIDGLLKVVLPVDEFIPAPAQGVLGLQTREGDESTIKAAKLLEDVSISETSTIERSVLNKIGGGCHVPLGAYCTKGSNGQYDLIAAYKPGDDYRLAKVSGDKDAVIDEALAILKKKSSSVVS